MKKTILLFGIGALIIMLASFASAICYQTTKTFGGLTTATEICSEIGNDGKPYIDYRCSGGTLYLGGDASRCDSDGCNGVASGSEERYYPAVGEKRHESACFSKKSSSDAYVWAAQGTKWNLGSDYFPQSGSVSGYVLDSCTGNPIVQAWVYTEFVDTRNYENGVVTNQQGFYSWQGISSQGNKEFYVHAGGYADVFENNFIGSQALRLDFRLEPQSGCPGSGGSGAIIIPTPILIPPDSGSISNNASSSTPSDEISDDSDIVVKPISAWKKVWENVKSFFKRIFGFRKTTALVESMPTNTSNGGAKMR